METFKAYVDRIIYRNADNGYTVLSAEESGCETVCVGVFRFIEPGEYLEFTGEFVFHPTYGEQFKVSHYETIVPDDIFAMERYLSSGAIKGLGPVTAKRIIDKFGEDALRILRMHPARKLGGVIHCFYGDWKTAELLSCFMTRKPRSPLTIPAMLSTLS